MYVRARGSTASPTTRMGRLDRRRWRRRVVLSGRAQRGRRCVGRSASALWGWWGFFSKQRQILTRQISVHTGNFLEDFRKHGRGGPSSQPLPAQANFRNFFWRIARPEHPLIRLAQSDLGAARRSAASRSWRAFSSAAMRAVASEAARAVALRSSLWAAADSARTDSVLILGVSCVYVCFNVCLILH